MNDKIHFQATPQTPFKFSRLRKISSSHDFKKVITCGEKISARYFNLFVLPNSFKYSRFGFSVSKRIASACERNQVKRILRENVRKNLELKKLTLDCVFIIKLNFIKTKKTILYSYLNDFFSHFIQRKFTTC